MYSVIKYIAYLFSFLPLRIHYVFSTLFYYILYYVIRYRRKTVRKNLENSFPGENIKRIKHIESDFYHSLCDYFVETLKLATISRKNIMRWMRFEGLGEMEDMIEQGKPCIVYLAHNFNWEWITSLPLHFKNEDLIFGQIYHPLENKIFDRLFLKLRGRFHAVSIPMSKTLKQILEFKREGRMFIIGFLADQVPYWEAIHHWLTFLHQETPVFTGTERIAKRLDCAVFYGEMRKDKRGHYVCNFRLLSENAANLPENKLTEIYFNEVENNITQSPGLWLWTHRRWKRTHTAFYAKEQERIKNRRLMANNSDNEHGNTKTAKNSIT